MAFTVTARQHFNTFTDNGGTSSTNAATTSATPTANSLLLVCEMAINDTHTTAQAWQTPSGGSLTYTLVAEAADVPWENNAQYTQSAAIHRADVAVPSAHTILVDCYPAGGTAFYAVSCIDITGYGSTTPVQSKANSSTVDPDSSSASATVTLDAVPKPGNLIVVSYGAGADDGGGFATPTAGSGKTFTSGQVITDIGVQIGVYYRIADGTESATITCSDVGDTVGNWTAIAVEIPGPPAGGGGLPLSPLTQVPYALTSESTPWAVRAFQPPIPLMVWANDNAPAASSATDATVAATAIVTTTAVDAPAIQTGSTVAGTAIVTTTAMSAPTITAVTAHSAIAIVTTTGMPAPAVQTGETVAATVVATTTAMPAPTITAQTVHPAIAVATVIAMPAPAIQTGQTVSAVTIATVTAMSAPVVDTAGNATAQPPTIATVTAMPAPVVQQGQTVSGVAIATVTALPAPTVQTGSTVVGTAIATVTALPAPAVSGGATVSATAVATVTALPAPAVKTGSTVSGTAIATVTALPLPTVSGNVATGVQGNVYPRTARAVGGSVEPRGDGGIIGQVG